MEIILAGLLGIAITLPLVFKFEDWVNRDDDLATVNQFKKFQDAFKGGKK